MLGLPFSQRGCLWRAGGVSKAIRATASFEAFLVHVLSPPCLVN